MKRRQFGGTLAGAFVAAGGAAPSQSARGPRKNTLMHVGGDYHSVAGGPGADITAKANLEYNLRHGVKHLTAQVRGNGPDGAWDLDELKRMRDNCDKHGVDIRSDPNGRRVHQSTERARSAIAGWRVSSVISRRLRRSASSTSPITGR